MFDALIGNTDRHQDNWGVVFPRVAAERKGVLSPCYDNGTSLGHERFTDRIADWTNERFRCYVLRGQHHMRWRQEDAQRSGHFEMIRRLTELFPVERARLRTKLEQFNMGRLAGTLQQLRTYALAVPLTEARSHFMLELITLRHALLLEYLQ